MPPGAATTRTLRPPPFYGAIEGRSIPGRFAPRSIAVTLVSTDGRSFTHAAYGQSLAADLIHEGVAGVSAHVGEPTLGGVTRPLLLADYARGAPAGEAHYRNVPYLSWMNVYVGDPLMQLSRPLAARDDGDGDGIADRRDVCRELANPSQRDSDHDGLGDACDADFDQDGVVGIADASRLERALRTGRRFPGADLDGDGAFDERDRSLLGATLHLPPGPGLAGRAADLRAQRGQP